MREENLKDISSLGGMPVYVIIAAVFFIIGDVHVFNQLLIAIILSYAVTVFFRVAYFRERPRKQRYKNILEKIDASSFPSLHSLRAAVLFIILSSYFSNLIITAILFLSVILVAIIRVIVKKHHVSDVIAGIVFGLIISLFTINIMPI